jgi:hypothetical protein
LNFFLFFLITPIINLYSVCIFIILDIAGANKAGWISILVRTGVFSGKGNDLINPAKHVADNILRAVEWMFYQEEGF